MILPRLAVAFELESSHKFGRGFWQPHQTYSIVVLLKLYRLIAALHLNRGNFLQEVGNNDRLARPVVHMSIE